MNRHGHPILRRPDASSRIIALGSIGVICQHSCREGEVIKAPLKHDLQGCNDEVIQYTLDEEEFSRLCFEREKHIYQILPKDPTILDCIAITEHGLHFPYLQHGNLRHYLQGHNPGISTETRHRWIAMAARSITLIHSHGIVHADISARNFLVADDLSLKLCDFSGSAIGDQASLVAEEDRYCGSPDSPRSPLTDIFALGCLIFEIMTGLPPYHEVDDDDYKEIQHLFASGQFPPLDDLPYRSVVIKCWTFQYSSADEVLCEITQLMGEKTGKELSPWMSKFVRCLQQTEDSFSDPINMTILAFSTIAMLTWWYKR